MKIGLRSFPALVLLGAQVGACTFLGDVQSLSSEYRPGSEGGASGAAAGAAGAAGTTAGGGGLPEQNNTPTRPAPSCPATPDATVVYVDAEWGDDVGGRGTCDSPYKSLTQALAAVAPNLSVITVKVAGGLPGKPLIYSAATTREVFPLAPRRDSSDKVLTLQGDSADTVYLEGAGDCHSINLDGDDVNYNGLCALDLAVANLDIRDITVSNSRGVGIVVDARANRFTNVHVSDSTFAGVLVTGRGQVEAEGIVVERNQMGVYAILGAQVTLRGSSVARNRYDGAYIYRSSQLQSSNTSYVENGGRGVAVVEFQDFTTPSLLSRGDTFSNNGDSGIYFKAPGGQADVTGATLRNNGSHGIERKALKNLTVWNSTLLQNGGSGVVLEGAGAVDFGTFTHRGENVFQTSTEPNRGVGLCNLTSEKVILVHNKFITCPPTLIDTCSGGGDASGTIQSSECYLP